MARAKKSHQRFAGGLEVTIPIIKDGEANVKAFAGADLITLDLATPFDGAKYLMKRYVAQLVLTKEDILRNSGPAQVISLIVSRRRNLEITLNNTIGTDMISSTGSAGDIKKVEGIENIVDDATTSGAIDPADLSVWKAIKTTSAETISSKLLPLQTLYGKVTIGADQPTLAMTTQIILDQMWERGTNIQRFVDETLAAHGFTHLGFNQRPVVVDTGIAAKNFFWLNEKYLWLYIHQEDNFDTIFIPVLPDQDVSVWRITTTMAFVTDNRRMHARHTSIETT